MKRTLPLLEKIKFEFFEGYCGLVSVLGVSALASTFLLGLWGSRGIEDVYKFQHNGKPAVIQKDDRIGPDRYWILLSGKEKIKNGTIISDNKKSITVWNDEHYLNSYYSVEESHE